MARSGGQPTAALTITRTSVSRAAWLYNDSSFMLRAQPQKSVVFSSSSRLVLFFRLLALHLLALQWQLAKSPALSAPSNHFPFHYSIFADLSTLYFRGPYLGNCLRISLFPPHCRLALYFHAFEWQLVSSPA